MPSEDMAAATVVVAMAAGAVLIGAARPAAAVSIGVVAVVASNGAVAAAESVGAVAAIPMVTTMDMATPDTGTDTAWASPRWSLRGRTSRASTGPMRTGAGMRSIGIA